MSVEDMAGKLEEILEGQRRMNRRLKDVLSEQEKEGGVIWGWMQLRDWADSVDRKLNVMVMDSKKKPIDEELERAINRVRMLARRIDLKVPDK